MSPCRRPVLGLLFGLGVLIGPTFSLGGCGTEPAITQSPNERSTSPATTPEPAATDRTGEGSAGSSWLGWTAAGGGGALIGLAAGVAWGRRHRPRPAVSRSPSPSPGTALPGSLLPGPAAVAAPSPVVREPDPDLVAGLLAVADLSTSPAVQSQVRTTLRSVGIDEMSAAPGEPFDVERHNGVGWLPTADPAQHMRVARAVRTGWTSATGVLRPADVEVFRHQERSGSAGSP